MRSWELLSKNFVLFNTRDASTHLVFLSFPYYFFVFYLEMLDIEYTCAYFDHVIFILCKPLSVFSIPYHMVEAAALSL